MVPPMRREIRDVPPKEKKSTETTPPPTLEEMIREIVSQEVYQQIQNS
jgi:hypothetical protein